MYYSTVLPWWLSEWVSECLYEFCVLFNSFFFRFCWTLFFPSRHFIHLWHGIRCLAVDWLLLVCVPFCINCCLLILPLLPTFVRWSSVFIFFNARAILSHTRTHTFYTHFCLSLCVCTIIIRHSHLHLHFFRPLDTRTCAHCFIYVLAIKRRLHALIAETVSFFNTFCSALFAEFFLSPLTQNNIQHWKIAVVVANA